MTYQYHVYTTTYTNNNRTTKCERIYKRPGPAHAKALKLKKADPDRVVGIYTVDDLGDLTNIHYISRDEIC